MFVEKIFEVHVEPTTVCQAECPMCPRTIQGYHTGKIPNKYLTLDMLQQKLDPIVDNLKKVLFCGTLGEPAACGDLIDMIKWIQSRSPNCVIGINSNGGVKDTKWWEEIAILTKNNIYSYVVFSIDGLADTNHLYRVNVNWDKVLENATAFINAGGSAHWDMLVFKHNQHQIEEAKAYAKNLGFKFFRTKVTSRFSDSFNLHPPDNHLHQEKMCKFNCMAEETTSVYLSASGLWYPCCYTHMSNEMKFDVSWGNPIDNIADRSSWGNLLIAPPKICQRSCATSYNKGQWTGEWQLV